MQSFVPRIQEWWQTADRTQRLLTIVGGVLLAGFLTLTFLFSRQPQYQPLFAGLSPQDQGMVVEGLNSAGIPSKVEANGTVSVPAAQVADARMRLAQGDKLPASGATATGPVGLSSFSTPAQEKEAIRASQESNLARSIATLESVKSAIVHISVGKDSPFADEVVPPSAVVNLQLASGNALGAEESKAIARLIQHAVPGLSAKDVSVIDSAGRLLYDGEEEGSPAAMGNKKLHAEIAESKRREAELQRRLDVAFGPGNTVVSVQVTLDMDLVDEEKRDFALGEKKVVEQATETMAAPPNTATTGNPVSATGGGVPGSPSYTSTVTANQFPSTETHTKRTKALGTLTSMYVSAIANSSKIADPLTVQSILDDYLGDRRGQPGFSASVQSVEFDTAAQAEAKGGGAAGAAQPWLGLLPVGALVLVGVLLSKSVGKALTSPRQAPGRTAPPAQFEPPLRSSGTPSVADAARALAADPDIAAALKEAGLEPMGDFESLDESVDVQDIRRRVDVPLEQIKKLAKRRPETVAMLLKGWLLEERA